MWTLFLIAAGVMLALPLLMLAFEILLRVWPLIPVACVLLAGHCAEKRAGEVARYKYEHRLDAVRAQQGKVRP